MTLGPLYLMRPEWLWLALPLLLLALALRLARRQAGSWSQVIDPELLPHLVEQSADSSGGRIWPWVLLAWLVATLALAGPSLHKIPQPVQQRADALVIVLDLSYSMKAGDLAPSRIDRARQKIVDLLKQRQEGQTALVAFAGDAHVVTPLTDDAATIINLLPALSPDMMPVPGSDAAGAVNMAVNLLRSGAGGRGRVLLLTDGVAASQHAQLARTVQDAGATLLILGVGTSTGAPLPLPDGGFLKDASGTIVVPAMDGGELAALAQSAGGQYLTLQVDNSDLRPLTRPVGATGGEQFIDSERRADQWEDQGYLLVLLLLPAAALLFRRGVLLGLVLLCCLGAPEPASAQDWDSLWLTPDQRGKRALDAGDPKAASELFTDPAWAGTAAYRAGDYQGAAQRFSSGDSADDWYNRGNALARAGDLDGAIDAYRESLRRQPDQADAQANLSLVEALKKQQQAQQQNQPQQQDPQQGDQNGQQQSPADGEQAGQDQQPSPQSGTDQNGESGQDGQDTPPGQAPQAGDSQAGQNAGDQRAEQAPPEGAPEPAADQQQPETQSGRAPGEPAEPSPAGDDTPNAAVAGGEQSEREQATEQWLRRVPDDPSGLLREKFRYESRQREQQGDQPDHDTYW